MNKTVVINVVGLTKGLIGEYTPFLKRWMSERNTAIVKSAFPAVTCTAQANYLTGSHPETHGIVGNGWYFQDECEVKFWKQSNKLVQAPKIWEVLKKKNPSFTCANMFWWYNMYSSADYSVTPRPQYAADGRKIPDVYSHPATLRDELQKELGAFPLFNFWGPKSSIESSQWIADASKKVEEKHRPTLTLIYLPHLDYALQKFGPEIPLIRKELSEIDRVCEDLIRFYEARNTKIIVLSEYGITKVQRAVHLNRRLREYGFLSVREERGMELLDPGASKAFAVADHQIAHIYVNDKNKIEQVRRIIEETKGVEYVLGENEKGIQRINHKRSGDLIAIADKKSWFSYYYWMDDKKAPDFARTVEIHKKPGYDPAELFFDPTIKFLYPKLIVKLLKKKMGFRTLMDVIPLDASLIKGSHGRINENELDCPIVISEETMSSKILESTEVFNLILSQVEKSTSVKNEIQSAKV
jgi:predicted AlkP superfamily pyrophosphatase or phosphodiesterase